ncbi:putative F-box protein At5g55150 [Amaranthus tricolor]|uniref:putative F-box protein At5g55150 n=1 Tax=Amaranthus tricolor TaxID=29722 RepID=UPI00258D47BE|nr:putative F-box protein At5g55150 [Amaranthus tricolor]
MSLRRRLPVLLIPTNDCSKNTRNIYSLPDAQVYEMKLPVPFKSRCIGSSHGWLIFIDRVSFVITLYNPFYFGNSKGIIHLPPFPPAEYTIEMTKKSYVCEFHADYYICKAVLSANPSSSNTYFVTLIHGETRAIAYYKSGDVSWTYMYGVVNQSSFFDVISHENYFLAANLWGEVYICEVNSNNPKITCLTDPVVSPIGELARRYLVDTGDGKTILQVVRLLTCSISDDGHPFTVTADFKIYKLEPMDGALEWLPVRSIFDGALFLGDNESTFVKATDFPGIISNSIYFTDDYPSCMSMFHKPYQFNVPADSGIFLIEDEELHDHHIDRSKHKNLPPPVWILPTI